MKRHIEEYRRERVACHPSPNPKHLIMERSFLLGRRRNLIISLIFETHYQVLHGETQSYTKPQDSYHQTNTTDSL